MSEPRFEGRRVASASPTWSIPRPKIEAIKCFGPPIRLWILSAELTTIVCHWNGERTTPCYRHIPDAPCEGCDQCWDRRVQSWMQAQLVGVKHQVRMCQITPAGVASCPLLVELGRTLFGRQLILSRIPITPRGKMQVHLVDGAEGSGLPDARDAYDTLCRMWRGKLRKVNFTPQCMADLVEEYGPSCATGKVVRP
jgi:hypothetical protein